MSDLLAGGGPAFPFHDMQLLHGFASAASHGIADPVEREAVYIKARGIATIGLSKREYFAGLALQGLLTQGFDLETGAPCAVSSADALMRALETPPAEIVKPFNPRDCTREERDALRKLARAEWRHLPRAVKLMADAASEYHEPPEDEIPF